jgi:hypothetical protein
MPINGKNQKSAKYNKIGEKRINLCEICQNEFVIKGIEKSGIANSAQRFMLMYIRLGGVCNSALK